MVLILTGGIGLITPPVGSVLFVGTAIGKISIGESVRTIWPFWLAALAVLLVVAFVPAAVAVAAGGAEVSRARDSRVDRP